SSRQASRGRRDLSCAQMGPRGTSGMSSSRQQRSGMRMRAPAAGAMASARVRASRNRERMIHLLVRGASSGYVPRDGPPQWLEAEHCHSPFLRLTCCASGEGGTMMTKRQKQMLDYLREYIDEHGYAPTLEEIGRHFRLASL